MLAVFDDDDEVFVPIHSEAGVGFVCIYFERPNERSCVVEVENMKSRSYACSEARYY